MLINELLECTRNLETNVEATTETANAAAAQAAANAKLDVGFYAE